MDFKRSRKGISTAVVLIAIIVIAIAAGAAYYYYSKPSAPARTIKIGLVASLTGSASDVGTDMQRASILAVEEINQAGGVHVKEYDAKLQMELVVGDDKTNPQEGVTAVKRLILEDNVDILVGGFSSAVTYASEVPAIENNVPFIITGASSSLVTRRTDMDTSYIFHYCSITDDYSETIVRFLAEAMKPMVAPNRNLRLAILYQDSPYGKGCYDSSAYFINELGLPIDIVSGETFKMGDVDFHTQLTKIKAAKPDAVYHAGFVADTATAIKQGLSDVGLKTVYVGVECNDDPHFYELIGEWGDYQILESKFAPFAGSYLETVDKYKEAYQKRWNIIPGMMGADTYDAIYMVKAVVENAGTLDKPKVRDAIEKIEMPQMLIPMKGGIIKFDENHEIDPETFIEQMYFDKATNSIKPAIVYPEYLKQADFVLPPDYEPGGE
jgi:branched-chain amino acid transport system substrate-binding protein